LKLNFKFLLFEGRGSVLNNRKETSMHALIMRGDTYAVGGVMCLKHVKNPIKAARLVMDHVSASLICIAVFWI